MVTNKIKQKKFLMYIFGGLGKNTRATRSRRKEL